MSELGTRLRDYLEAAAPPITEEEVRLHPVVSVAATLAVSRTRRRVTPVLVAAAAVLAVLVVVGLFASSLPEAPVTGPIPDGWRGLWPQTSSEDAMEAQSLADVGHPDYAWQAPGRDLSGDYPSRMDAISVRFVQEMLGWRGGHVISSGPSEDVEQDWEAAAHVGYVIRCGEGVNPLYPDDPVGAECPPTINATRYEVVRVTAEQLVRRGRDGIWLVTGWVDATGIEGGTQAVPPAEDEVRQLMLEFLEARLSGSGAEGFVGFLGDWNDPVELDFYATRAGSPFEEYEITSVSGPEWPSGTFSVTVRLTARDGTKVEEGVYYASPEDVRLRRFTSHSFSVTESL
jgi:hypothetical protein